MAAVCSEITGGQTMCLVLHVESLIPPVLWEEGMILVLLRKKLKLRKRLKNVSYSPRVTQHRNGRVWLPSVLTEAWQAWLVHSIWLRGYVNFVSRVYVGLACMIPWQVVAGLLNTSKVSDVS